MQEISYREVRGFLCVAGKAGRYAGKKKKFLQGKLR